VLLLSEQGSAILHVAFSSDGQHIRAMTRNQSMVTWDAASPAQLARWIEVARNDAQRVEAQRLQVKEEFERRKFRLREDSGAIRDWLVLAPIPLDPSVSLPSRMEAAVLDTPQLQEEAHLRPRAGDVLRIDSKDFYWTAVSFDDYALDFNELLGETTDAGLVYAVAYLRADRAHADVSLWVGSDDSSKVFLNGQEVHRMPFGGFFAPDAHRVDGLRLHAGLNTVVFKVVNTFLDWRGAVRFSDAANQPIPGLEVTLNPDEMDPSP
jgi:hypothetical protein